MKPCAIAWRISRRKLWRKLVIASRAEFQNSRGLRLIGNFFPAQSDAVIVMAHGFASNKSSRGRFDRLAEVLNKSNYSALAFDFSGCGESDDDSLTVAKQVDDLRSATAFVRAQGFKRVGLFGNSLGSLICLRACSPEIATMILMGALTGPMHYDWIQYYSADQLRDLAAAGRFTIGVERKIVIETQTLRDFEEVDQLRLLVNVKCPVLIIHGDGDEEERQLLNHSRTGIRYLPEGSRLEVLPGASHGLIDRFDEVIALTLQWLPKHLA